MEKSIYFSEATDLMNALAKFYTEALKPSKVDEIFVEEVNAFAKNKFQEICNDLNITKVIDDTSTEILN